MCPQPRKTSSTFAMFKHTSLITTTLHNNILIHNPSFRFSIWEGPFAPKSTYYHISTTPSVLPPPRTPSTKILALSAPNKALQCSLSSARSVLISSSRKGVAWHASNWKRSRVDVDLFSTPEEMLGFVSVYRIMASS